MFDLSTLRIIIPACGVGERFVKAGYAPPKHLIPVLGKPMIAHVLDWLPVVPTHIIVRKEHLRATSKALKGYTSVSVGAAPAQGYDSGAVGTLLSAPKSFDPHPVMVVNCDNVLKVDWPYITIGNASGLIFTFNHPMISVYSPFSHARVEGNRVTEVAEKLSIGPDACAGAFMFPSMGALRQLCSLRLAGSTYDERGEMYVAPLFNILIAARHIVVKRSIEDHQLIRMGTPQELQIVLTKGIV